MMTMNYKLQMCMFIYVLLKWRGRERGGKGENTRDEGRNAEKEIMYDMNVGNQRGSRERLNAIMAMQPYRPQI